MRFLRSLQSLQPPRSTGSIWPGFCLGQAVSHTGGKALQLLGNLFQAVVGFGKLLAQQLDHVRVHVGRGQFQ